MRKYTTAAELAERLGVNQSKIGRFIRSGELVAIDMAMNRGGRPRWRIEETAIVEFLEARSTARPTATPRRRRKPANVLEFF